MPGILAPYMNELELLPCSLASGSLAASATRNWTNRDGANPGMYVEIVIELDRLYVYENKIIQKINVSNN